MKRINVSVDENDLQRLKDWFHSTSDDEAVRSAISHVLNQKAYSDLLEFEGKIKWEGNLDDIRTDRQ
ncbi:hypothetical protein [uncultured Paenibacillus sp.]|uniref:hypothetical protein n=1 Tax=uncultured Paenibacillus sp. TaxID=227322 RepID=UPI0028D0A337|nr:hypothetical protein [uncultured Paenibacillus sp.]